MNWFWDRLNEILASWATPWEWVVGVLGGVVGHGTDWCTVRRRFKEGKCAWFLVDMTVVIE